METITMNMDTGLYRKVQSYAQQHKTNVQQLVERYVLSLVSADETTTSPENSYKVKPLEELPQELQSLIGIARKDSVSPSQDINGRDIRDSYLAMKYAQ